jgi:hypothetical protein
MKFMAVCMWILVFSDLTGNAQNVLEEKFHALLGEWYGAGEGFSGGESHIQSSFLITLDGQYLEVKNHSEFQPTEQQPEGENHIDHGYISYDKSLQKSIYRQFNNEGYVNQYVLNNHDSSDSIFIFETEIIENFVPGGQARLTIIIQRPDRIKTLFDVSFPGKEFACFGTNRLIRK